MKPPKPISPEKPERPSRSELRKLYRDFNTSDIDQRVEVLKKALNWYDQCLVYVKFKQEWQYTVAQNKLFLKAEKLRQKGINSNKSREKETSYIQAINLFEEGVDECFTPPLLINYIKRLAKDKDKLVKRKKRMGKKFGDFLYELTMSLKPKNSNGEAVELKVDKLSSPHLIDSDGNVTFNRDVLLNCQRQSRKHGFFTGIIQLLPVLASSAGRIHEVDANGHKTGKLVISNNLRLQAVFNMLSNLNQWQQHSQAPRKLIRRVRKPKSTEE